MGSTADKVKGGTNEAIGKAKQGLGEAVGSDRLEGEGVIQEIKGKGQKAVGDAKEATKDAVNKAAAAANKNSLIGSGRSTAKDRPLRPVFLFLNIVVMAGLVPGANSGSSDPTSPPAVRRRTSASRSAESRRRRRARRSRARVE